MAASENGSLSPQSYSNQAWVICPDCSCPWSRSPAVKWPIAMHHLEPNNHHSARKAYVTCSWTASKHMVCVTHNFPRQGCVNLSELLFLFVWNETWRNICIQWAARLLIVCQRENATRNSCFLNVWPFRFLIVFTIFMLQRLAKMSVAQHESKYSPIICGNHIHEYGEGEDVNDFHFWPLGLH